jgi:hypothetical protein
LHRLEPCLHQRGGLADWLHGRDPSSQNRNHFRVLQPRLHLAPYLGQILRADLSAAHVQAMFAAISREHADAGMPVPQATLVRIKATLRAALNAAIRAATSPSTRHLASNRLRAAVPAL